MLVSMSLRASCTQKDPKIIKLISFEGWTGPSLYMRTSVENTQAGGLALVSSTNSEAAYQNSRFDFSAKKDFFLSQNAISEKVFPSH